MKVITMNPICELCREKDATRSKTVNSSIGQRLVLTCDDCYNDVGGPEA